MSPPRPADLRWVLLRGAWIPVTIVGPSKVLRHGKPAFTVQCLKGDQLMRIFTEEELHHERGKEENIDEEEKTLPSGGPIQAASGFPDFESLPPVDTAPIGETSQSGAIRDARFFYEIEKQGRAIYPKNLSYEEAKQLAEKAGGRLPTEEDVKRAQRDPLALVKLAQENSFPTLERLEELIAEVSPYETIREAIDQIASLGFKFSVHVEGPGWWVQSWRDTSTGATTTREWGTEPIKRSQAAQARSVVDPREEVHASTEPPSPGDRAPDTGPSTPFPGSAEGSSRGR